MDLEKGKKIFFRYNGSHFHIDREYNKFLNYSGNLVLKANGQWARSSMYSFANAGISSLLSGWY